MRYWKYFVWFYISFIVAFVYIDYQNTMLHENAHKQNAIYHGCAEPNMTVTLLKGGMFKCNEHHGTEEQIREELNLDTINEIVGYNITSVYYTIFICAVLVSLPLNLIVCIMAEKDEEI